MGTQTDTFMLRLDNEAIPEYTGKRKETWQLFEGELENVVRYEKLFSVEHTEGDQAEVTPSGFLLSLPNERRVEILAEYLGTLREDFEECDEHHHLSRLDIQDFKGEHKEATRVDLEVQIAVTEGFISHFKEAM